jgi:hypothetical protein
MAQLFLYVDPSSGKYVYYDTSTALKIINNDVPTQNDIILSNNSLYLQPGVPQPNPQSGAYTYVDGETGGKIIFPNLLVTNIDQVNPTADSGQAPISADKVSYTTPINTETEKDFQDLKAKNLADQQKEDALYKTVKVPDSNYADGYRYDKVLKQTKPTEELNVLTKDVNDDSGKNNILPPKPVQVSTPSSQNKIPIRDNPLSAFSDYTYNISLYIINPDSFNQYLNKGTVPSDWNLICRSGGINNSSGQKNDGLNSNTGPRADGFDLDYYIDNLHITSDISSKETLSSAISFEFQFQVIEPYGFTFPTRLVKAAQQMQQQGDTSGNKEITKTITALETQYMLVLRFYGYDSKGNLITNTQYPLSDNVTDNNALFERTFPIIIYAFDFKLDNKMVTYNIKAKAAPEQYAYSKTTMEIPETITVRGETVQDVLQGSDETNNKPNISGLMQSLNDYQKSLKDDGKIDEPDTYKILFEPNSGIDIATVTDQSNDVVKGKTPNKPVTSANQVNVKNENKASDVSTNARSITFNKGDTILQSIDTVISQSSYILDKLKTKPDEKVAEVKKQDKDYAANTPEEFGWYSVVPTVQFGKYDKKRNTYSRTVTYVIKRYETPYIKSTNVAKALPYYGPYKRYKHWYMSNDLVPGANLQEKEIISYDLQYNLLYLNLAGAGSDAKVDETSNNAQVQISGGGTNPQGRLPGTIDKALSSVKTFMYSPADQIKAKIVILGDPDFLLTSSNKGADEIIENKWETSDKTINAASGQVFIEIEFRDAEDYDTRGSGLLNPSKDGDILFWDYPANIKQGIQGVVYNVWQVLSSFVHGVFTQELKVCAPNFDDFVDPNNPTQDETARENTDPNSNPTDQRLANGTQTANGSSLNNSGNKYPTIKPTTKPSTSSTFTPSPNSLQLPGSTSALTPNKLTAGLSNTKLGNPLSAFNVANDDKSGYNVDLSQAEPYISSGRPSDTSPDSSSNEVLRNPRTGRPWGTSPDSSSNEVLLNPRTGRPW